MGRRDRRHGTGAFWRWAPVVAGPRPARRRRCGVPVRPRPTAGSAPTSPTRPPSRRRSRPPPGLTLPRAGRARRRRRARRTAPARPRPKVRRALAPFLRDRDLGRRVLAAVADADRGRAALHDGDRSGDPRVHDQAADRDRGAARCSGPTTSSRPRVVRGDGRPDRPGRRRRPAPGPEPPAPTTTGPHRADVVTLARQTAAAADAATGAGAVAARPTTTPCSPARRSTRTGRRLRARRRRLADHRALGRRGPCRVRASAGSPTRRPTAASEFAGRSSKRGIRVAGRIAEAARRRPVRAGARRGRQRAAVQIVERVLEVSDNEAAEVLARHVGLAVSGEGSFEAGAAAVLAAPCAGSASRTDDAARLRRQRAVPREPARPRDPARRAPGGRRAATTPSSAPR